MAQTITKKEYDNLIALSSAMSLTLQAMGVKNIAVENCHGEEAHKIEQWSLEEIDDFLDVVFEAEYIEEE